MLVLHKSYISLGSNHLLLVCFLLFPSIILVEDNTAHGFNYTCKHFTLGKLPFYSSYSTANLFFHVFQCLIISFSFKGVLKPPMVPFNQYQQQMRWSCSNQQFSIYQYYIIVVCNMLIVSSIDAYFFYSLFFPILHHQTFGPFFFVCIPKLLGIIFCKFVVVLPPVLGFPPQLHHFFFQ